MQYSFGLPGPFIWTFHIVFGILLAIIGFRLLNNKPVGQIVALFLIVLGILAMAYHSHIWYTRLEKS